MCEQRDGQRLVAHGPREPSRKSKRTRYRSPILIGQGHAAREHQVSRSERAYSALDRGRLRNGNVEDDVAAQIVAPDHVDDLQPIAAASCGLGHAQGQRA